MTARQLFHDVVGYIDGIRFDPWGNPLHYDILPQHPGGQWTVYNVRPEQVPARYVMHWFQLRRPGQHRAVPEFRSTLNLGGQARRFRGSTLTAAEAASLISILLKTQLPPDDGPDGITTGSALEFLQGMMVAAPMGWDFQQLRAEHPNATFESFMRALVGEQGRPKQMPYNIAACDSSSYERADL